MNQVYSLILTLFLFLGLFKNVSGIKMSQENEPPSINSDSTYGVVIEYDIEYAKGLSHDSINSDKTTEMSLKLDVYAPDNNHKKRPVFVFIHGGGFAGGSKQQGQIKEWANYYASRGWVFISIDYRLKKDLGTVPKEWVEYADQLPNRARVGQFLAIYPTHRDAKAALRWVVTHANSYNIDTSCITVGGGSAGAITAISMGISETEDFRDEISIDQDPTLATVNMEQKYEVKTIINLWGSKVSLDAIETIFGYYRFNKNNPPLFIAHGTEDTKVPFSSAEDLKEIYNAINVPFAYYPLKGKGHGAWGAQVNNKSLEELAFDFIVKQQGLVLKQ